MEVNKSKITNRFLCKYTVCSMIVVAIITIYLLIIRPVLMRTMSTVAIELIVNFLIIIAALFSLIILLAQLLKALFTLMILKKHNESKISLLKLKKQAIACGLMAIILLVMTIASQWMAYTPPILNENNTILSGSIAALEKVELNGSTQWITIRGKNTSAPILLFLAGGPGGSQLAAARDQLKGLEDHFVVIGWDQPGSAKSFNALSQNQLTLDRYINDGCALASYLCERFNQQKIYIVGESWGSALGILMVQKQPELFSAFIGTGQMVSFLDTEHYCYELALNIAAERGDSKTVQLLTEQGPPPYYGNKVAISMANYLMYLFKVMSADPSIASSSHNTFQDLAGTEYGLYDKVTYILGLTTTLSTVYQQLYEVDLRKDALNLEVPVYFFEGRHDINAPTAIAEEYFNKLNAPNKQFVWFENSGHTPWVDENELFVERIVALLINK